MQADENENRATTTDSVSGLLVIDKPAGLTSARVVARIKRLLPRGVKVGHAGTLDPFATGVLILLIGRRATRRCEEIMGWGKTYEATIKLGATTATLDPSLPEEVFLIDAPPPALDAIRAALRAMTGHVLQAPPVYSALKVAGRRASDRVRDGDPVDLRPRPVRIDCIEVVDYAWPLLRVRVDCGRGTYVRAIARDLGARLGVGGGYLTSLRRTAIGQCKVEAALPPDALSTESLAERIRRDF